MNIFDIMNECMRIFDTTVFCQKLTTFEIFTAGALTYDTKRISKFRRIEGNCWYVLPVNTVVNFSINLLLVKIRFISNIIVQHFKKIGTFRRRTMEKI